MGRGRGEAVKFDEVIRTSDDDLIFSSADAFIRRILEATSTAELSEVIEALLQTAEPRAAIANAENPQVFAAITEWAWQGIDQLRIMLAAAEVIAPAKKFLPERVMVIPECSADWAAEAIKSGLLNFSLGDSERFRDAIPWSMAFRAAMVVEDELLRLAPVSKFDYFKQGGNKELEILIKAVQESSPLPRFGSQSRGLPELLRWRERDRALKFADSAATAALACSGDVAEAKVLVLADAIADSMIKAKPIAEKKLAKLPRSAALDFWQANGSLARMTIKRV